MTDTPDTSTHTLHSVPDPEPLHGLTGHPADVYTQLAATHESATVAELALATGLSRSTVSKALNTIETHGLAVRTPGTRNGPRRTPDHWRPAPTSNTNSSNETDGHEEHAPAELPADTTAPATYPAPEHSQDTSPDAHAPEIAEQHGTPKPDSGPGEMDDGGANSPGQEASSSEGGPGEPDSRRAEADSQVSGTASAEPVPVPGGKTRLAPGALRDMVIDHLKAHPGEAFTATRIGRVLERSSGAVANALDKLVRQGIAERVTERPRTYRMAAQDNDT
ncbi:MarR family transcriptional regulator [Streptomyces sp. NPDC002851]